MKTLRRLLPWLAVAAAALWAAGRLHPRLLDLRREAGLNQGDPLENAPPLVAFTTVALGGFRGLAADILWMRASELQDKGDFIELVQLADWITKLQPRFASVWAYHGWNLAYNVSIMFPDPADRWRWVRHGISLLRDEGMHYNPGSALLYRELAWMFQHKIGMDMDQAHAHYKREWAREMSDLFGGARPDFDAWLAASDAPADPLHDRARRLRDDYKLDLRAMLEVEASLGAQLDWRLPSAHAIYWASRGLPFARSAFDRTTLRRQIFQSSSDLFIRGRLTMEPGGDLFVQSPNLDLLPAVRRAYEEGLAAAPGDTSVQRAHRNFLVDAVMIAASYNRMEAARELYADLTARYAAASDPELPSTAEGFVAATWRRHIDELDTGQALAAVEAALYQAAFWHALGDKDAAAGFERIGVMCWTRFMDGRKDAELRDRTGLPTLQVIRDRALDRARADLAASRPGSAGPGRINGDSARDR